GDLDEYAAWLRSRPGSESSKAAKAGKPAAAPQPSPPPKPGVKVNPHRLAKAEAEVATLEAQLAGIDAQLADPALYAGDGARAAELAREQAKLRERLEQAEAALLGLYDAA